MNFEKLYEDYLIYIEYRLKEQSKNTLKERFKNKILPFFKDYNIEDIDENVYLKWQNEIEIFNYSNSYKCNLHYLMTNFYEYLKKYHGIEKNVPRNVGNFKLRNEIKEYHVYSNKEFKHFVRYVKNDIYKQFFNLMFYTGLRPGEAMALKFSDLNDKILSINKTIDEHKGRTINSPKTKTSIRKIEIDRKLNKDLLNLKKYYIKKYNKIDDYYIFGGIKPLSPTTINRYKKNACVKANLKPIKLHEFRHSHATLLVSKKLMIKEVSRRLGHSNANITLNTYTHTKKEYEKRVVRTLNFMRLF